ncbi:MAG: hypothetical protein JXR63_04905 [Spirochaetales bacterium]|nr:hypothetical protein [Spirochaetales bacterium]
MKERTNKAVLRASSYMTQSFWRPAITGFFFIVLGILAIVGHSIIHKWFGVVIGALTCLVGFFVFISAYKNSGKRGLRDIPLIIILFAVVLVLLGIIIMFSDKFMNIIVLVISVFYFIAGLVELYIAISVSPYLGITGFLLNSLVSLGLAIAVWVTWKDRPDWFLGFIIGAKLISYGFSTFLILWLTHSKDRSNDIEVEILDDDEDE